MSQSVKIHQPDDTERAGSQKKHGTPTFGRHLPLTGVMASRNRIRDPYSPPRSPKRRGGLRGGRAAVHVHARQETQSDFSPATFAEIKARSASDARSCQLVHGTLATDVSEQCT